jgi:hypothetical protein
MKIKGISHALPLIQKTNFLEENWVSFSSYICKQGWLFSTEKQKTGGIANEDLSSKSHIGIGNFWASMRRTCCI